MSSVTQCVSLKKMSDNESQTADTFRRFIDAQDADGNTPLMLAAKFGNVDAAKLLLRRNADTEVKNADHMTALHWAAKEGHLSVVEVLVKKNSNINAKDKNNFTPLQYATNSNKLDIEQFLKSKLPRILDQDVSGRTNIPGLDSGRTIIPEQDSSGSTNILGLDSGRTIIPEQDCVRNRFIVACNNYDIPVINAMLAELLPSWDSEINPPYSLELWGAAVSALYDDKTVTVLHFAALCVEDFLNYVIQLLRISGNYNIDPAGKDGETPLFWAVKYNMKESVKILLKNEADPDVQNNKGETPLQYATNFNKLDIEQFLKSKVPRIPDLSQDCARNRFRVACNSSDTLVINAMLAELLPSWNSEINAPYSLDLLRAAVLAVYDDETVTVLHFAALCVEDFLSYVIQLLRLIGRFNIDPADKDGETPLFWAVKYNMKNSVKFLLENEADPDVKNNKGETALHCAAKNDYQEIAEYILNTDVCLLIKDKNGRSALHVAALNGHRDMAILLINECANPNELDMHGYTPLRYAAENGCTELVKEIIGSVQGEVTEDMDEDMDEDAKDIAIITKVAAAFKESVCHLLTFMDAEAIRLILEIDLEGKLKSSINDVDKWGNTPLMWAIMHNIDAVETLLEFGADPEVKNQKIGTALHLAAKLGNQSIVKLLIEKGADVNVENRASWTPLHCAAAKNHRDVVEILVQKGSNIEAKDWDDCTPLDVAKEKEMKDLLIALGSISLR